MKYDKNNPLRVITLFSGYDSQCLALDRVGVPYDLVAWCEIDNDAIQAHDALFPQYADRNVGDITKVDASTLPDCDLITWSFPCGLSGTFVKTEDGYKKIEDVKVGDCVLTHNNRYRKVLRTMSRQVPSYYTIKATGCNLRLTAEHPLLVLRDDKQQWIRVSDLRKTDMVSYNIPKTAEPTIKVTDAELWLLGRFVADGWIDKSKSNSVELAIGVQKEKDFRSHALCYGDFKTVRKGSCVEYRLADKRFHTLCLDFGNGAKNKRIPEWVVNLPKEQILVFLDGYFSGDGHIRNRCGNKILMFSTVSKELFLGIQSLILKVYGKVCSLFIRKDARKESFSDTYNGQIVYVKSPFQKTIGDKVFVPVKSISLIEENVNVYNLSVDDDESYTCDNVISHNCTDISQAGLQAGLSQDSGTRSSLAWDAIRIFEAKRPKYLMMENVKALVSSKFIKDYHKILSALDRIGYTTFTEVLNAKNYGVPQNRERVFGISILRTDEEPNPKYHFPKPIPLEVCLGDILEEEVDEKYFLSDEMLARFCEKSLEEETVPSIDIDAMPNEDEDVDFENFFVAQ